MLDAIYINTVRLLLDVIPDVFVDAHFAIKGGTAINLFAREAPRLSVDIDLVYLNGTEPREVALATIAAALQSIDACSRGAQRYGARLASQPSAHGFQDTLSSMEAASVLAFGHIVSASGGTPR